MRDLHRSRAPTHRDLRRQEPFDAFLIERQGGYRGLYHVLHGAISPVDRIGPRELRIAELEARVRRDLVGVAGSAVLLATERDIPGKATGMYLYRRLMPLGITVRHIGLGG